MFSRGNDSRNGARAAVWRRVAVRRLPAPRTAVRLVHEVAGLLGNLDGEERNLVGRGNVAGAVVTDEIVLYPLPLGEECGRRGVRRLLAPDQGAG